MKKSKFDRYLKPTSFDPKDHWMVGIVWPMQGSKGKEYSVELHNKGFNCDCTGFAFHGYCKHSKAVLAQVERAMA
jgi:hypothetical protein